MNALLTALLLFANFWHTVLADSADGPALALRFNTTTTPVIWAETACDARAWQLGLQYRDRLMPNHGMLFVFPGLQRTPFWMKDTHIALDAGFLDASGRLFEVQTMAPCRTDPCPLYAPQRPYRYVLEMRAGWFGENALRPGAQLAPKVLQQACKPMAAAP